MASSAATSHVNALESKHAGLEAKLREEMARPAPDTATIQALKKQKLRLKEEIIRA
ncbi:MAG: YdcH family protein [Pseudomonadota bacterium]